jgi:hypothetical protein
MFSIVDMGIRLTVVETARLFTNTMEMTAMKEAEIQGLFRSLNLETEEQRAAMRFEPLVVEHNAPVQVVTTDSTSYPVTPSQDRFRA